MSSEREQWKEHLTRQTVELVALLRAREADFPGIMQEALEAAQAQEEDRKLLQDPDLLEGLQQMREGRTRPWSAVRGDLKEALTAEEKAAVPREGESGPEGPPGVD